MVPCAGAEEELTSEATMTLRSRPQHGKRHTIICPTALPAGLAEVCTRANEDEEELIMNETPVWLCVAGPGEPWHGCLPQCLQGLFSK